MNPTNCICVIVLFVSIFAISKANNSRIVDLNTKCGANAEDSQVVLQYRVPSTDTGKCLMLCFLKELDMLDSNQKYDEVKSFQAFRNFWSAFTDDVLKAVNSAAAVFAKGIDSKSGTCEYGYEIMKFINAEFIKNQLLTTTPKQ
ncbi:uncharacterized protein LOC135835101 [Planococcus citri]|uniref:uncharacterized protein LOC135835101 n=1 Tax=Planococcus citri TaxID=170843 RepID=UPI0031F827A4